MASVSWGTLAGNCQFLTSFVVRIDDFSQTDVLLKSHQPSYVMSLEPSVIFYFYFFVWG